MQKTPVYCFPGMAADVKIFEFIQLPDIYELYFMPWQLPKPKESLSDYAKRIAKLIKHPDAILMGVSFGGILIQEIANYYEAKKLVVISSIKTKHELPTKLRFLKKTNLNKLLPTKLISYVDSWESLLFFGRLNRIGKLYDRYLTVKDSDYLDWCIEAVINWDRESLVSEHIVHIQGDKDHIFPIDHIKDCIVVPGGRHVMIVNRARWFNEHLPSLLA